MTRHLLVRLCAVVAISTAGCAAPNAVPPGGEAQLLDDIKAGTVELDCNFACSPLYIFNQTRIQQLYRAQNWPELALAVAKTKYRRDIAYFYLGVAAQGMQAWAAADRYYRIAGSLSTGADATAKCSTVNNLCAGFSFPRDIVTRLRVVSAALGRVPVDAQAMKGVDTGLHRVGDADYLPEAPQWLLGQYAVRRLKAGGSGNPKRDQDFQEQLLETLDPQAAQTSRNNEIARPRALQALVQRLAGQGDEQRLVLGMWVQLRDYDLASQSFELRYPLQARGRPVTLNASIYNGESPRRGPSQAFSGRGSTCVWENPGTSEYVRADEPEAHFLMLTLCQQRPAPQGRAAGVPAASAELPPLTQLTVPPGSLWPRLRVPETRAEPLLRKINPGRWVWAELVFDVRAIGAVSGGPFPARETIEFKRAGMTVATMPRALFVWETAPEARAAGKLLAVAGDVVGQAPVPEGRLMRHLVRDRTYDTPPPVIPEAAGTRPAPRAAPAAPSRPVPKPAPPSDDDEEWVEPPPARR